MDIISYILLPFRKEKELYSAIHRITGYYPRRIELYKQALLHKSIMRRNDKGKPVNNERLEFLGDAVLDAVVGHIVYDHFPGKREGFLTNTRSKLVQRETLGKLAKEMGINGLILSNGRSQSHNSYMGGNAFEALVGALYLDHGYNACMRFMEKQILSKLVNIDKVAYKEVNFKSKLLEWSQKNRIRLDYELIEQKKDENGSPIFTYQVLLEGVKCATGKGFSKKESQQMCSKLTLEDLKKKPALLDAVFAAKTERTKMEETPVMVVPNVEEPPVVIETQPEEPAAADEAKPERRERRRPRRERANRTPREAAEGAVQPQSKAEADPDFDLSDISSRAKTREEIIAEAEAAAFE